MIRACFLGTVSVDLVWNVCMGAAVIGLSIISKGAVGMGDGLLFLSLGTVLSFLLLFLGDCGVISVRKREKD